MCLYFLIYRIERCCLILRILFFLLFIVTPSIDTIAHLVLMMSLHTKPPSGYGFD